MPDERGNGPVRYLSAPGRLEVDHGHDPITWLEIFRLLMDRPLLLRTLDRVTGEPGPSFYFDPNWEPEP